MQWQAAACCIPMQFRRQWQADGWGPLACGNFGDFGVVTTESAVRDASRAFAALNDTLGLELQLEKSERGARLEFPGVTVCYVDLGFGA